MGPKTDVKTEDLSLVQAAVDSVQCLGLPGGPRVRGLPCSAGDMGSTPGRVRGAAEPVTTAPGAHVCT